MKLRIVPRILFVVCFFLSVLVLFACGIKKEHKEKVEGKNTPFVLVDMVVHGKVYLLHVDSLQDHLVFSYEDMARHTRHKDTIKFFGDEQSIWVKGRIRGVEGNVSNFYWHDSTRVSFSVYDWNEQAYFFSYSTFNDSLTFSDNFAYWRCPVLVHGDRLVYYTKPFEYVDSAMQRKLHRICKTMTKGERELIYDKVILESEMECE